MRDYLGVALAILAYGVGILCSIHALMTKTRTSSSALAWIVVCTALPVLGAFLYLTIGQDRLGRRRESELRRARARFRSLHPLNPSPSAPKFTIPSSPTEFLSRMIERLSGARLLDGNSTDVYVDGERAYPMMLDAIANAKRSIAVQFYIFDDDRVGKEFRTALIARASAGVQVRVLYDAAGCARNWSGFWKPFSESGVRVAPFMPLRPIKRKWQINLRNHRKILICDGEVAFTGSMNVSARHLLGEGGASHDIMLKVRGPVVAALSDVFADDWFYASGEDLKEEGWISHAAADGRIRMQVLESGPDQDTPVFHRVLLSAIHQARHSTILVTPYFVPDTSLLDALTLSVARGIRVELLVPERPDHLLVRLASQEALHQLTRAGAIVRTRAGPMIHMKLAIVDEELTLVGSSNLDNRSFFLNFEADLAIFGTEFAAKAKELVEAELAYSAPMSVFAHLEDGALQRFARRIATLMSPVL